MPNAVQILNEFRRHIVGARNVALREALLRSEWNTLSEIESTCTTLWEKSKTWIPQQYAREECWRSTMPAEEELYCHIVKSAAAGTVPSIIPFLSNNECLLHSGCAAAFEISGGWEKALYQLMKPDPISPHYIMNATLPTSIAMGIPRTLQPRLTSPLNLPETIANLTPQHPVVDVIWIKLETGLFSALAVVRNLS